MNGTDVTIESGKLMKTLYMHMSELLVQSDDNIMRGVDIQGIFVMNIEQDHVYAVLIESVDSNVLTVRNKRYTIANDIPHDKRVCINIRINDYNEDATVEDYIGDYSVLKLFACGTEPSIYRTIRIMDITGDAQSVCTTDESETETDKPSFANKRNFISDADKRKVMISSVQKLFPIDTQSSKSNASNNNDDTCAEETCDNTNVDNTAGDRNTDDLREELEAMEETCDNNDTDETAEDHNNDGLKQDIENLLHDVDELEVKLINITDRSALIKYYIETHATSIGDHVLQNEVRLLNTYLSSIGKLYGNNLARISQNIKDTLGI